MKKTGRELKPGDKAVLVEVPPGFIDDLPAEDQKAISKVVGKPVKFNGHDVLGQAELEFRERNGTYHTIWVKPEFVRSAEKAKTLGVRKRPK